MKQDLPENSISAEYAENILQSGVRATAIIQDLLTMARRGVIVSKVVNLNNLVITYLKTPEFENLQTCYPNVRITTELENGLFNIKGSPVHLIKTIMNLVSNAAESMSGEGKVSIKTKNRYLDQPIHGYDTMQEGDYIVLIVSDTGSGISAHDLDKIFEPFYTKKVMGRSGTGLGLAVVWGTVKDHNGYIDVKSKENEGSTFTLYFPVTRDEPAKAEKTVSHLAYTGKGESILVVDDVKEQREMAISILGRLGYQVKAVASGEDAIEYLKNKKADLIVLDMIMPPGIDGFETYRRITEINPRQKAVIVSGFSETDRVRDIQEMGAGEFVRKPYTMEKIGLAIKKELDQ
jgi:CheY-like chemotaxis protein